MAKAKTHFECQHCGYQSPRWLGRCPECGKWGSLTEEWQPEVQRGAVVGGIERVPAQPLSAIPSGSLSRMATGIAEFDRAVGGGLIPGSLALVGGDPGIGKSTLLLQAAAGLGRQGRRILYISGEESPAQTRDRAERVGALTDSVYLAAETLLEGVFELVAEVKPELVILDSIQTTHSQALQSPPGSLSQVREVAGRLLELAKSSGIATVLIGHVTKEGAFAGPKALEHIVDTVMYFEGERQHAYRILRATKNRFGSIDEIGVFEMTDRGLVEVKSPSGLFLAGRPRGAVGSVVVATLEGTRPFLVEVQALVTQTSSSFPRRVVTGADPQRVALVVAVLEKRVGLRLGSCDVFVNVAGGMRVLEPAADLGIAAALASSFRNLPVDPSAALFGEVGLSGEVRAVRQADRRIQEVAQLGFTRCLVPHATVRVGKVAGDINVLGLATLDELMDALFP
ncbi:MAG: DNA repair protein RadA [Candidatus Methylomirabilales bacterium]